MAFIISIGTAIPKFNRLQIETIELVSAVLELKPAEKRLLRSIYKATGIEQRHSVISDYCKSPGEFSFFPNNPSSPFPSTAERMELYKDNALELALTAINDCLSSSDHFELKNITHLITISCTGMYAPGLDIELVQKLKLNPSVKRTAVNFMGCYGAFNGLKLAESICAAEVDAKVLLVSVELCTIHFQKNKNRDNIVSNAIFSDGAAAAIIQAEPNKKCFKLNAFYCDLLLKSNQEMTWHIGNDGFDIVLSSYVPEIIQSGIHEFTQRLLEKCKLKISEIDFFAIHPGGKKILEACEEALNIKQEDNRYSYQVLKDYGNMSSATILFVLKEIWKDIHQSDHNKTIFSCAFGPGLTLESMLLSTHHV